MHAPFLEERIKKAMAKIFDISSKITNELPSVKITDDIIVTINNRKSTILNIQAMALENDKKEESEKLNDYELILKSIAMLVGEKKASEIDALNLPVNEFREVYDALMEVALTGTLDETP